MGLTAVTLLGDNTVPILEDLCRYLARVTGLDIEPDGPRPTSSREAAERARGADLAWSCGYLARVMVDSGRLDAEIVAAPVFAGEAGPVYHSVIVTANPAIGSLDDARGGCLAVNERVSWSGHHALDAHLRSIGSDLSMFDRIVDTGSHAASVEAVARGRADLAAIDHTVWAHLATRAERVEEVRIVDRTVDWPAPPFVLHRRVPAGDRRELATAFVGTPPDAIDGLDAVVRASRADYDVMSPSRR